MATQTQEPQLLIVGCKKIGRLMARTAATLGWSVTVMDQDTPQYPWPPNVESIPHHFLKTELGIPPNTHAIINRGHKKDAEVVQALVKRGAKHIYLIASATRGQEVLDEAMAGLDKKSQKKLQKMISVPAGLDLGGEDTASIALSILAEIQLRHQGGSGGVLNDQRPAKLAKATPSQANRPCPGKAS
ncbi:Xanthine and CO dehydrogenases maturation factor XdhC/CoxF family-like protein [Magnetococcus marinus MC-1]|uniref:Xanthine and CO dehydrogenases maturation factor XdhC/CoxF family-like protein n=1 Tax=Magnetococcus marinus (strain ATCC BAA-1437 / JCM 17883 / MC-1) TaxID=156889 RepID=A0L5F2_MAGMM|nr:XdhC family protein [Magnetococcus marinus]ABK43195.1 Xanthine and CO dehydrogenases maturation factor XdhC/CoxF family-like protein [Magnetococcus marinus MC-1]